MEKKDKCQLNGQLGGHNATSSANRSALEGPQKSASPTKKSESQAFSKWNHFESCGIASVPNFWDKVQVINFVQIKNYLYYQQVFKV